MKKFSMRLMSLVLAGGLMLSVVACGTKTSQDEKNSTSENQVSTQEVTQADPTAEPTAEPAKIVKIKMWEKPTSADTEVSKAFYT